MYVHVPLAGIVVILTCFHIPSCSHQELRFKLASWTFAHLNKSFPLYDMFLYYFMMVVPGLSLTTAIFMLTYFPYLLVSIPVALAIILFGFFGTIINHRLPHDAQYQNPGAFGAFLSGLLLTVICYFIEVFPRILTTCWICTCIRLFP